MFKRIGILIQRKRLEKIEFLLDWKDYLLNCIIAEAKSENFSGIVLVSYSKQYVRTNKKLKRLLKRAKVNDN